MSSAHEDDLSSAVGGRNKEVSRQKIKAISPDLENYGLSSYLNPTRKTPLPDCFTNNPKAVLKQGLDHA
jgi:hypothetical protein